MKNAIRMFCIILDPKVLLLLESKKILFQNLRFVLRLAFYLELKKMKDAGEVPDGVFAAAEKRLQGQIVTAFEKCRACGCDIFELTGELHKNKPEYFPEQKSKVLENTLLDVSVTFRNVR